MFAITFHTVQGKDRQTVRERGRDFGKPVYRSFISPTAVTKNEAATTNLNHTIIIISEALTLE